MKQNELPDLGFAALKLPRHRQRLILLGLVLAAGIAIGLGWWLRQLSAPQPEPTAKPATADGGGAVAAQQPSNVSNPLVADSVELTDSQLKSVKVQTVGEREFTPQRETVGSIAFNDEMSVQVFSPYQGRIRAVFAKAGDNVKKGQTLFTIDSPDLVQAQSTLISTAGTLRNTTRVLERAKQLFAIEGIAQKDLDQATSDQQAAEATVKGARNALRIFGMTDAEMDQIIAERRIDALLSVRSPIDGTVTSRNAAPGLLVQPGNAPAPFTVSDVSTMWMLANVPETDLPLLRLGEKVEVAVNAYPGRVFHGSIVNIGAAVDPNTHRVLVRSVVRDAKHELRPGLFATFVIRTGDPILSVAIPLGALVREGDGAMTVWVATDGKRFTKRTVRPGIQQGGFDQALEGLRPGEQVATDGALFISNALLAARK